MSIRYLLVLIVLQVCSLASGFLPGPLGLGAGLQIVVVLGLVFGLFLMLRKPAGSTEPLPPPVLPALVETETKPEVPPEDSPSSGLTSEWIAVVQGQEVTLAVVGQMGRLVAQDAEEAVLSLSRSLFDLVENSRKVSAHIEESLGFLTGGDGGLATMAPHLETHWRAFEELGSDFKALRETLEKDLSVLTSTVETINSFSDSLSDLADQTNVLAINASIEAARVGIHGRGFAVIATNVQALAKNSKAISEKMASTIRSVVQAVELSFTHQTERIELSRRLIGRSGDDLRAWSSQVGPQLERIETVIQQTHEMASKVTKELNAATVSLQFQDRIRQILEHLGILVDEVAHALERIPGRAGFEVPRTLRDETWKKIGKIFTVDQESALVGMKAPADQSVTKKVELF